MVNKNINPIIHKNNMPFQAIKELVELLNRHSIKCTWEQAIQCPCFDNGSPKIDCPLCHGQGWVYKDPYDLDIAVLSDNKQILATQDGSMIPLSSIGIPQITSNGIEDGIKPSDRITVKNWNTPQNYIFNVTNKRLKNGLFMPYKVNEITHAYIIENNTLVDIKDYLSLDENNILHINNDSLLGKNISMILSVEKRFYVVALNKELRYAQFNKIQDKEEATGNGNKFLTYKQFENGEFKDGIQIFKMPNQLLLRRENLYFPNYNIIESDNDDINNYEIKSPTISEADNLLG